MAALELLLTFFADGLALAPRGVLGALAGAFLGFQVAYGRGAIAGMIAGLLSGLYLDVSESPLSRRFKMPFLIVTLAVLAFAIGQWLWM